MEMNTNSVLSGRSKANGLIHIVDSDPAICESLSLLLRLEGYETSFSLSSDHFLTAVKKKAPNIAVVDLQMESGQGMSLLREARQLCQGIVLIMLAKSPLIQDAVIAMHDGAVDVFEKPVDHERLISVIRGILGRNVLVSAGKNGSRDITINGFKQLTPREREVLQLLVNGRSNKECGRELGISPRTIEVHRGRVMEKLFARNTADLMRIVLSQ